MSVSLGRSGRSGHTAQAEPPQPRRGGHWGSTVFTVIALIGSFHGLLMLGAEAGRLIYTNRDVVRLEAEVAALDAETRELQAIVNHQNDPVFREQLAREQGFIGPNETRVMTRMP